uniref:Uncharacterized protein n=1 Tax=Magnetococcus massalia (strain MO-1) TaxID=451514 RepID=A0A1S7LCH4_MAGMO|nr:conserved protein of unknown function [Candidatus Magnetococcus massalia]
MIKDHAKGRNDQEHPGLEDYLELYGRYPKVEFWQLNHNPKQGPDPYLFLFRQLVGMMAEGSRFNQSLPSGFTETAKRYVAKDPVTLKHFKGSDNRYFLLSDLRDWLRMEKRKQR